jgi:hypothetical protein
VLETDLEVSLSRSRQYPLHAPPNVESRPDGVPSYNVKLVVRFLLLTIV